VNGHGPFYIQAGAASYSLYMSNNGNVGIGTTSPAHKLDVAGEINASSNINAGGNLAVTGTISGNGSGLTSLPGANVTGTVASATSAATATSASTATTASGLSCTGCVGNTQLSVNYAASTSKGGAASNALLLNGKASSDFQPAGSYATLGTNTFSGTQTVTSGDLVLPATAGSEVGVIMLGGAPFAHSYGSQNTFVGAQAGNFGMTGGNNTAIGYQALYHNTTGNGNTATGLGALMLNTTGIGNTANGGDALFSNTTGIGNTASGYFALTFNTTGKDNTASGAGALHLNETGDYNTASGDSALYYNSEGGGNTAIGYFALFYNTTGGSNTAVGFHALENICFPVDSCAAGHNTALGDDTGPSDESGSNDTFIGAGADAGAADLTNATAIGANALVGEGNALVLGSISGVHGATSSVNVGIGTTTPATRLHVADGDVYASTAGSGVIVKSPDGTKCARIGIDNDGNLVATSVTCP
jgi:trimeric autotransporter adhesin